MDIISLNSKQVALIDPIFAEKLNKIKSQTSPIVGAISTFYDVNQLVSSDNELSHSEKFELQSGISRLARYYIRQSCKLIGSSDDSNQFLSLADSGSRNPDLNQMFSKISNDDDNLDDTLCPSTPTHMPCKLNIESLNQTGLSAQVFSYLLSNSLYEKDLTSFIHTCFNSTTINWQTKSSEPHPYTHSSPSSATRPIPVLATPENLLDKRSFVSQSGKIVWCRNDDDIVKQVRGGIIESYKVDIRHSSVNPVNYNAVGASSKSPSMASIYESVMNKNEKMMKSTSRVKPPAKPVVSMNDLDLSPIPPSSSTNKRGTAAGKMVRPTSGVLNRSKSSIVSVSSSKPQSARDAIVTNHHHPKPLSLSVTSPTSSRTSQSRHHHDLDLLDDLSSLKTLSLLSSCSSSLCETDNSISRGKLAGELEDVSIIEKENDLNACNGTYKAKQQRQAVKPSAQSIQAAARTSVARSRTTLMAKTSKPAGARPPVSSLWKEKMDHASKFR